MRDTAGSGAHGPGMNEAEQKGMMPFVRTRTAIPRVQKMIS